MVDNRDVQSFASQVVGGGASRYSSAYDGDVYRVFHAYSDRAIRDRREERGVLMVLIRSSNTYSRDALKGRARQEPGPRFLCVRRRLVDQLRNVRGEGDVESDGLAGDGSQVHIHIAPTESIPIAVVGLMFLNRPRLREELAVHEQSLDVAQDGLFGVGECLVQRVPAGEAAGQIGHDYPIATPPRPYV